MKQSILLFGLLMVGLMAFAPMAEASRWHVNVNIGTSPYPYYVVPVYYPYPAVYYPVYYPSYYPVVVAPAYTYYSMPSYAFGPSYIIYN